MLAVARAHTATTLCRGEHSKLLLPSTKWQQFNELLKLTLQADITNYRFWNRNQKCLVEMNNTLLSTSNYQAERKDEDSTVYIDAINFEDVIKVNFEYESNFYSIDTLKTIRICDLLKNLEIQTLTDNYVLVLNSHEENKEPLLQLQADFQQPVGSLTSDKQVNIRISTLITVERYGENNPMLIPISSRNVTTKHILHSVIKIDGYLASLTTMTILDDNQLLSFVKETKFYLLKERETCLVTINTPKIEQLIVINDDNDQTDGEKRCSIYSTITQIRTLFAVPAEQFLVHSNDFIPSNELQLSSLLPSPDVRIIAFSLTYENLPITIRIRDKNQCLVMFNCSKFTTIKRLCEIGCLLFKQNSEFYQLLVDDSNIDETLTAEDIYDNFNEFIFQLSCTANINCYIEYETRTIELPCSLKTLTKDVFLSALQKFEVDDDKQNYGLYTIDDDVQIDLDNPIEDYLDILIENSDAKLVFSVMAVAAEVITYITNAFPNAPHLLGQIVSKYAPQLTWCAAFGLSAVWEYVYDRLHEQNPETIPLTSASEKVAETSSPSGQGPHIRNGYSDADKKALEQILENATKLEPKGQLHQYCKKGTYDDAKQDLEKLSGNMFHHLLFSCQFRAVFRT
ncbi:unnamed protein product, partial [Didymodactylos carnosus]